eukprot:gene20782-biopygen2606
MSSGSSLAFQRLSWDTLPFILGVKNQSPSSIATLLGATVEGAAGTRLGRGRDAAATASSCEVQPPAAH